MILGYDFIKAYDVLIEPQNNTALIRKMDTLIPFEKKEIACYSLDQNKEQVTQEQRERQIEDLKNKFPGLFSKKVGKVKNFKLSIKLKSQEPFKGRTYPIPEAYRSEIAKQIDELVIEGILKPAKTEYINPITVAKKHDGSLRMCLDDRLLNKQIKSIYIQPPTIEEILMQIGDAKLFAQLDITKAFWSIELDEKSQLYTGFIFMGQTSIFYSKSR